MRFNWFSSTAVRFFGDGGVGLARGDLAFGPAGEAHMGLGGISAPGDQLGGGVAVDGLVHLVLHGGEELLRGLGAGIVVDAGGVDF